MINYNEEAEQIALGSIIQNNDIFYTLNLDSDDFLQIDHIKIFEFLKENITTDISVNSISIKQFMESLNCGAAYLQDLLINASIIFAQDAAKTLRELTLKRKCAELCQQTIKEASDPSKTSLQIKESLIENLEDLKLKNIKTSISLKEAFENEYYKEKQPLFYTGFEELDNITEGFECGDFVIIAGRPAMGKSALATSIALNVCETHPVLIFSLEMQAGQVARRIVANSSSVGISKIKHKKLNQNEDQAIKTAINNLENLNIQIIENGGVTLHQIKYEIKKHANKGFKYVFIDYIQLIKHQASNSVTRVTEITNALKAYAMEYKVVIVGLSQLSRAVESRDDKKPQLSDLRDSGSIEQDANCVIFTFRPEYYLEKDRPDEKSQDAYQAWERERNRLKGAAYAIVAKNREGSTGQATLFFDGQFARFMNQAEI